MDYGLALSLLISGIIVKAKHTVMKGSRQQAATLRHFDGPLDKERRENREISFLRLCGSVLTCVLSPGHPTDLRPLYLQLIQDALLLHLHPLLLCWPVFCCSQR